MGERLPILIAGAGIGGLTAALAINARGLSVIVCERAEKLSEIGAGIQIAPNAGRVLAALGLDKTLAAAAIEPKSIDVLDGASGRTLTSIPPGQFRARYGFPYRVIHRADLQSILAKAAARAGIRIDFGATVEGTITQPNGLLVRLRKVSGGDVVSAAAIIGADGVWSSLREMIPGAAQPMATGRTAWRAIISTDIARDLVPTDRVGLWLGPDAHLVHYPVAQGAAVNLVAIIREAWERPGWSAPGNAIELGARFAAWSAKARALIAAPISWQKFALLALDPAAAWVSDRLALVGDAAHAMTPFLAQGAAMAIEDGWVLAEALYGAPDIPAALLAYAEVRRPRVARVAAAVAVAGDRYHYGSAKALARNAALRLAGPRLILGPHDWIYGWQPAPADRGGPPASAAVEK
ncbi:MAG: FAD-dependent monooxygenase [Bauldia sp.]